MRVTPVMRRPFSHINSKACPLLAAALIFDSLATCRLLAIADSLMGLRGWALHH